MIKPKQKQVVKKSTPNLYKNTSPSVKPRALVLSCFAYNKIRYLANTADTEIGFWGIGRADDPMYVEDVVVIKQTANIVYNKFDDDAFADFVQEMSEKGLGLDEFALIWGHTHPKGCNANPSSTDENTFSNKSVLGNKKKLIMFILSQSGDMYARLREETEFCTSEVELNIEIDTNSFQGVVDKCVENPDIVEEWNESLKLVHKEAITTVNSVSWSVRPKQISQTASDDKYFGQGPGYQTNHDDTDYDNDDWWNPWESGVSGVYEGFGEYADKADDESLYADEEDEFWVDSLFIKDVIYDERGEIDNIVEFSDQELEETYGCDSNTLNTVYATLRYDLDVMYSVVLIKYCAYVNSNFFNDWSLSHGVADVLAKVAHKVRKKETLMDTVRRLFTKNKQAAQILENLKEEEEVCYK